MEIIKLLPAFKDYIWGGTKLRDKYGKKCDLDVIAESWEVSTREDGMSYLEDGTSFLEYIEKYWDDVMGSKAKGLDRFPLLIKYIDAKENLSLQVHPDDEYALEKHGELGKTESWYIIDAEEGAYLYYGFSKDYTKSEVEEAIKNGTLESLLNKVYVKKGDTFFINPGTVHAICSNILICEVQQNSNITYRLFDYNRVGKDGKLRPLHIEDGLKVSKLEKPVTEIKKGIDSDISHLGDCKYFSIDKIVINGEKNIKIDDSSFRIINVVSGNGEITYLNKTLIANTMDSFFVPASNETINIKGDMEIIISSM